MGRPGRAAVVAARLECEAITFLEREIDKAERFPTTDRIVLGGDIITHVDGVPVDEWTRKTYSSAAEGERHEIKLRVVRAGEVVELPLVTVHRTRW